MTCKHSFYSFDVFDTCLIRTCGHPAFVFDLLAERILGKNVNASQKADFSMIRRKSEILARQKHLNNGIEEITIEDIYSQCDFTPLTSIPNNEILEEELLLESELLVPVYQTVKEIERLRANGKQIGFISDMYLPEDFIKKILKEYGLYKEDDKLYVSSTYKKTKASGNLYRLVKTDIGINFKSWVHYGDNEYSDFRIPADLGISARKVDYCYSLYEAQLASREYTSDKFNVKLMASISRAVRLSFEESPNVSFAADFVAPLYVPFVCNLLCDAQNHGLTDVFFLARDAKIFFDIAQVFKQEYPSVNCHYLYVSRKSLYLPGMVDISKEAIYNLFIDIDLINLTDLFEKLHLTSELNLFQDYNNYKGRTLVDNIFENKDFKRILLKKSVEQRELCIKYFCDEGLANGKAAIVDLSGTRKCHKAINSILSYYKKPQVWGYYYDVLSNRIVGDDYSSFLFEDRYEYNKLNAKKSPQLIFEQYFSITDHNSTASYKKEGEFVIPVFEKDVVESQEKRKIYNTNKMVCLRYANIYRQIISLELSNTLGKVALSIYTLFYYAPSFFYLKAMCDLKYGESNTRSQYLIYKQSIFSCLRNRRKNWIYGNLVYNLPFKSLLTKFFLILYYYRLTSGGK